MWKWLHCTITGDREKKRKLVAPEIVQHGSPGDTLCIGKVLSKILQYAVKTVNFQAEIAMCSMNVYS